MEMDEIVDMNMSLQPEPEASRRFQAALSETRYVRTVAELGVQPSLSIIPAAVCARRRACARPLPQALLKERG